MMSDLIINGPNLATLFECLPTTKESDEEWELSIERIDNEWQVMLIGFGEPYAGMSTRLQRALVKAIDEAIKSWKSITPDDKHHKADLARDIRGLRKARKMALWRIW